MKKRLLALTLAAVMCFGLVACGGGSKPTESAPADEPVTYRELYESEVTTMNYLYTATTLEFKPAANFIDTLIAKVADVIKEQ